MLEPFRRTAGEPPLNATVYRPARLLINATDVDTEQRVRAALGAMLERCGWSGEHEANAVQLQPGDSSTDPIDAWELIRSLRSNPDPDVASAVGLDHLMSTAEQLGGNPFALGHGQVGLDQYGSPGEGGRGPVGLVLPLPAGPATGRRPRVVVLDTGIGDHPWFLDRPAQTRVTFADGRVVGPAVDPGSINGLDADGSGAVADRLLGTLASHSGHGTFIAGLLRQSCPEADIVALAVMGADGIVPESTLTDALSVVADRQREQPGWADALVLSLGYYAETGEDLAYNTRLKTILLDLGRQGIAVFCAAGNDASSRPSYPAAFAVDPAFAAKDVVPLVSVAALNPDGTVALFSNDGPWVTAEAQGVNLVSTAPTGTDGSTEATLRVTGPPGRVRAGIDPDDFESGFASWSGTSFAAPVLAGRYLRALATADFPPIALRRQLMPIGRNRATG